MSGTSLVLPGIARKRAELAGETIAREAALDQLRADLAHLDAASRIMCPVAEPELIRPRKPSRKGCDWFGRQGLPRLVLEALRAAEQPLSCTEIVRAVMTCKGMVVADHTAPGRIAGMVKRALHRRQGRPAVALRRRGARRPSARGHRAPDPRSGDHRDPGSSAPQEGSGHRPQPDPAAALRRRRNGLEPVARPRRAQQHGAGTFGG